jgi:ATP-binding cassette, subfamily C, bacterial LapB
MNAADNDPKRALEPKDEGLQREQSIEAVQETTLAPEAQQEKTLAVEETWEVPPAHHIAHDPLLGCLVILTRMEHTPFSPETLIAGLPLQNNKLTPELFIRAAARAGLSAQIVSRAINDISPLVMPAVLLLKNRQACVLVTRDDANATVTIIHLNG